MKSAKIEALESVETDSRTTPYRMPTEHAKKLNKLLSDLENESVVSDQYLRKSGRLEGFLMAWLAPIKDEIEGENNE